MSQPPRQPRRAVSGVLLLDKPTGITSNTALQRAKRLYRAQKAGHTGSLDPLASGLLPLCFGEATKVSGFLLDADKAYEVACRFGTRTDTADADGSPVGTGPVPSRDLAVIEPVLLRFLGEIEQIPPMYSALKHEGKRLYDLARAGHEVVRAPRRVTIYDLKADRWLDEATLALSVRCSKGTYVRTLVEDLAAALGTVAHVAALRRTASGPYRLDEGAVDFDTLERTLEEGGEAALDALLLPTDSAIKDWPKVTLGADAAFFIRQGQPVIVPKAPLECLLRLYGPGERFLGIGYVQDDGRVAPKRLIANP